MRRSAVRSGTFDARDRASKRRRAHRRSAPATDPHDAFVHWVEQRVPVAEEIERVDLRDLLRRSTQFMLPPEERLRLFAIACENEALSLESSRARHALDRIYQEALRLAPEDAWVHASRGSSLVALADLAGDELGDLFRRAHESLTTAAELEPNDAHIGYQAAYAAYMDGCIDTSQALRRFDRVLELEPDHGWARLYRAHCLHDLQRWREAAHAYELVPREQFHGPSSWRMDLLVEQLGWCRLRAGDTEGARADFERILARYEQQPRLAEMSLLRDLTAAAEEAFGDLLPRVLALRSAQTM